MNSNQIKKIVLSGLFAALVCVSTLIIHIPTVTKGYVNLGDCIINISAWVLGPAYGAAASGIGSALADIISGYAVYAPATLVIKGLMAAVSAAVFFAVRKHKSGVLACVAASFSAELVMCLGYFLFEGVLYHSFAAAALGISANAVQGAMGMAASAALYEVLVKHINIRSINR